MNKIESKLIIITGASKGIGKAIALRLGKSNTVILIARSEKLLDEVRKEISNEEGNVDIIPGDVTKEEDIKRIIRQILEKYDRIDVLINNAGIGRFNRIDQFSSEDYKAVFDVNVYGTFLFCKYVVPTMIKQHAGQIINISSVAGLNGFKSGTLYSASKFAVNGFTESLREDLKEFGIAVTAVCPGGVNTKFGDSPNEGNTQRDYLLEADDVARTVEYLVSESETANTKLVELKPRRRKRFRGS